MKARRRKRTALREPVQVELPFANRNGTRHGGARKGAGRKKAAHRNAVAHRARERFSRHHPQHVTLKVMKGIPSLRAPNAYARIKSVLSPAREAFGARLVHYSVMRNHVHMIWEAGDWKGLASAIKGLEVRIARALNILFGRRGQFFLHRYHVRVLRSPREVKTAFLYVLNNARRHAAQSGERYARTWLDPFSSASSFDGWIGGSSPPEEPPPVMAATTWLLRTGWKRSGLLPRDAVPG